MIKSKIKISGGFRTEEGAKTFAKIRSFISTIKLKTSNVIDEIVKVFKEDKYSFENV